MLDREMNELCMFVNDVRCLLARQRRKHRACARRCEFAKIFKHLLAHINRSDTANADDDIRRSSTRLKVMIYCHIMEADYPYLVLLNLLRILRGKSCCFTFYRRNEDDEIQKDKHGKPQFCRKLYEKIGELSREDRALNTGIGGMLSDLLKGDLRNAFAHSQYTVESDGSFIVTRYFSGTTGETPQEAGNKHEIFFSSDGISVLYEGAWTYLTNFIDCYKKLVAPFKDGGFHATELSRDPIRWDPARCTWTWQPPAP
jgi:hypothetical protein